MARNYGYKKLTTKQIKDVETEIKMLLHASRDCLRNLGKDTKVISFSVHDAYFAEAFGIMRGLVILRYGYFGSSNLNGIEERGYGETEIHNVQWWFSQLEKRVLDEEGFGDDNKCEHCMKKYHKDASTARVDERK
jgi:hypothetical protein